MSGDLARDKAFNKMAKIMAKSDGKHDRPETILQQVKKIHGDRWRIELDEMFIEESHDSYKEEKAKAIKDATHLYEMKVPVWERSDAGKLKFMRRELDKWRTEFKKAHQIPDVDYGPEETID